MTQKFQNHIAGRWSDSSDGRTFENRNPAKWDEILGSFPLSTKEDVDRAATAAEAAFRVWRLVPAPERGNIMRRVGDIMVARKEEIATIMTREMGKPLLETRGDVQEGIDTAYYCATEGRRLFGINTPSELRNKLNLSFRVPIGVCGLITPWNFPMAIPTWNLFPGLVAGNSFVFKPAEDTPWTATVLVEILLEAGVPEGCINLVHGAGEVVGAAIVAHPLIRAVSFTGSTSTGRIVAQECGKQTKHLCLEMGGKNAEIVMDDADLDLALEGALWGAFGTTGQRCTATSRLILHEKIHDEFVQKLVAQAARLQLGDGLVPTTDVGPVINENQRKNIERYVKIGKDEGATCVLGGESASAGSLAKGWFFQPTIFTGVSPEMRIATEEIFGPVLSVLRCSSLEEAIEINNSVIYGLSSSIYTRDVNKAMVAARDLEAGITYINSATIGAEAHMPFGGVKATGNGHREGGWAVFDFYTEWKSVYIDYSGKLQRAQIDNA
ncbi:MAG: aldehyde dehydrogenase family protein [Bacteroidota bacterium]|nr:aldehyde dehydrogenase family protein [Bacteroidota bacterium]MDP4241445.1 aldehyde dehydrogenase family protein [Bacteroidota bacterium]MDP4286731.1 aldehyde dehydrogenase family protein [Bacteroidota bacterium]